MADKSFIIVDLILRSGRFGRPRAMARPYGGILGTTHHNTATAIYPIGTVIELWTSSTGVPGSAGTTNLPEGWSEFVYGTLDFVTGDSDPTPAARQVCVPVGLTQLFDFTNDQASEVAQNYGVISISAMTNNYYGWFWSGGVCPCDLVATDFAVSSAIACVSAAIAAGSAVQVNDLSADALGLGICDGTQEPLGTLMVLPT